MIHGDQVLHFSSCHRHVYVLWLQNPTLSQRPINSYPILAIRNNVMSKKSVDIVDHIGSEQLEPAASLDPRSVNFAHSSLPHRSLTRKQSYAGKRQAGSPLTSGGQTDGIPSSQPGRDTGHRHPEGDIVLQRTGSHPNDTGLCFGNTPSHRVSFHLVIG